MKRHSLVLLALAAGTSFVFAQDKEPPAKTPSETPAASEKDAKVNQAALEKFKKAAEDLDKWMQENDLKRKPNPAEGVKVLKEMISKFSAMPTEGLPSDLKEPFEGLRGATQKLLDVFKDFPLEKLSDQAAMQQWVQEQMAKDPEFLEKFQKIGDQIKVIAKEGDGWQEKFAAAAKKYGLDLKMGKGKKDEEADAKVQEATKEAVPGPKSEAPAKP